MERRIFEDKARIAINRIEIEPEMRELLDRMRIYDYNLFVHSQNVAFIVAQQCIQLGMKKTMDDTIRGALLHDIGKLKIDKDILNKNEGLCSEDYTLLKMHPRFGIEILKEYHFSMHVQDIILHHHEKIDGGGYPDHLTKKDISKELHIVIIADMYDALTSKRCYGREYSKETALNIIHSENGIDKKYLEYLSKCTAL